MFGLNFLIELFSLFQLDSSTASSSTSPPLVEQDETPVSCFMFLEKINFYAQVNLLTNNLFVK
jgi:hypothetical protein